MAKTVMIVEDNALNRKVFGDLLQAHGYNTIDVVDGTSALAAVRKSRPDLILMDIQLPGLSGLDVARAIKADAALKATPIIALTAFAMPGDEQTMRDSGCDAYLAKPVSTKAFFETIGRFLD